MTEKDIQKISEEYKDEKAPLYDKIHERVEELIVQQAKRRKKIKTFYKVLPVALAMVLIVSLAIVLPIVLQADDTPPGGNPVIWYSDVDITSSPPLEYNLKEYAKQTNEPFLYIDLYDIAEDVETRRFYKKDDESITVYLQEFFTHGETGYIVKFTVMKSTVIVESFDDNIKEPQLLEGYSVDIQYEIDRLKSYAQFEYDGYKYYLEFEDAYGMDEDFLAEIISNMFNTQQAVA